MGPWRAAINWHMGVFVLGSIAATVATLPVLVPLVLIYGDHPFKGISGWVTLRVIQILQSVVIGLAGGWLTHRYFRRRISVNYTRFRRSLIVTGGIIAALPVALGIAIAISKYGPTLPMMLTASLIFGTFIICFLAGSFHFAQKLEGQANTPPEGTR